MAQHHIEFVQLVMTTPAVKQFAITSRGTEHPPAWLDESLEIQTLKRRFDDDFAEANRQHQKLQTPLVNKITKLATVINVAKTRNAACVMKIDEIRGKNELIRHHLGEASRRQDQDHRSLVDCNKRCEGLESRHKTLLHAIQATEHKLVGPSDCEVGWRQRYEELRTCNEESAKRLELISENAACCLCDLPATLRMECCKVLVCGRCMSRWRAEQTSSPLETGPSCLYCRACPASTRSLRPLALSLGSQGMPIHVE